MYRTKLSTGMLRVMPISSVASGFHICGIMDVENVHGDGYLVSPVEDSESERC